MLYARLGDVRRGTMAQDQADATRPASLPRFAKGRAPDSALASLCGLAFRSR
jgi:hypothetical protein